MLASSPLLLGKIFLRTILEMRASCHMLPSALSGVLLIAVLFALPRGWVGVPPKAANFSLKMTFERVVLCCITFLFCVSFVALPFSASVGVIVHRYDEHQLYSQNYCSHS